MPAKKDEKVRQEVKKVDSESNYIYLDDHVKDFLYSDYVRVRSGPRGMLLSFGKSHPDNDKFTIISEILVPLDVSFALKQIIETQLDDLVKDGINKKIEPKKDE